MEPGSQPDLVANPHPLPCKVCNGPSPLFGVVDFHKSCIEAQPQGHALPLSGCPVYYRRCQHCAFTFTTAFDSWSQQSFRDHIYNADYLAVDPDFVEVRPAGNAKLIAETFQASRSAIDLLDYGGGDGLLAQRLRDAGYSAATYDPFSRWNAMPSGKFDLITCFEVMEHVVFPAETIATMVALLKPQGIILFSTLLQPPSFDQLGLTWWYAGPRNGHVSLYTSASLAYLFRAHQLKVGSFSQGMHIAYAQIPSFAAHLNFVV